MKYNPNDYRCPFTILFGAGYLRHIEKTNVFDAVHTAEFFIETGGPAICFDKLGIEVPLFAEWETPLPIFEYTVRWYDANGAGEYHGKNRLKAIIAKRYCEEHACGGSIAIRVLGRDTSRAWKMLNSWPNGYTAIGGMGNFERA